MNRVRVSLPQPLPSDGGVQGEIEYNLHGGTVAHLLSKQFGPSAPSFVLGVLEECHAVSGQIDKSLKGFLNTGRQDPAVENLLHIALCKSCDVAGVRERLAVVEDGVDSRHDILAVDLGEQRHQRARGVFLAGFGYSVFMGLPIYDLIVDAGLDEGFQCQVV